jgi:hypothetical protein
MELAGAESADFRNIVLRGLNVASFKFALAKTILELAEAGKTGASLEELAVPFSRELCAHIREVDTQSTSPGSRFLDACRHFNAGRITEDEMVSTTALLGFNNVIDAFHVVDRIDVDTRFFIDERQQSLRGIRFTDDLLRVAAQPTARQPLVAEAESRWRLVESAWHERRSTGSILRVVYDRPSEMIVRGMLGHRRDITWVLAACLRHLDDRVDFGGMLSAASGHYMPESSAGATERGRHRNLREMFRDTRVRQLAISASCSGSARVLDWLKANQPAGLELAIHRIPGWNEATVKWLLENYRGANGAARATTGRRQASRQPATDKAPSLSTSSVASAPCLMPPWASLKADAAVSGSFGAWRLLEGVVEVPPCPRAARGGCEAEFGGVEAETHRACAACRIASAEAAGIGVFRRG